MNHKSAQARRKLDAAMEEKAQDKETELQIEGCLQRWRRRAIWLGIALLGSIAAVVPFLYGYPLHGQWDAVGKKLLVVSMCLLPACMYAVGTTFSFWLYLRNIRKIHRELAPPDSNI
jgi:hypothetical protein